jgi:hypothetical protein
MASCASASRVCPATSSCSSATDLWRRETRVGVRGAAFAVAGFTSILRRCAAALWPRPLPGATKGDEAEALLAEGDLHVHDVAVGAEEHGQLGAAEAEGQVGDMESVGEAGSVRAAMAAPGGGLDGLPVLVLGAERLAGLRSGRSNQTKSE